jgi:peptidoglycan/LPS O-acetylase OafA/YrhL
LVLDAVLVVIAAATSYFVIDRPFLKVKGRWDRSSMGRASSTLREAELRNDKTSNADAAD